jgi:hypothetical protein
MVFKATFKFDNILIILWQSVLLVEYPEKTTDLQYRKSLTNLSVDYLCVLWLSPHMQSVPITTNVMSLNPANGNHH